MHKKNNHQYIAQYGIKSRVIDKKKIHIPTVIKKVKIDNQVITFELSECLKVFPVDIPLAWRLSNNSKEKKSIVGIEEDWWSLQQYMGVTMKELVKYGSDKLNFKIEVAHSEPAWICDPDKIIGKLGEQKDKIRDRNRQIRGMRDTISDYKIKMVDLQEENSQLNAELADYEAEIRVSP